MNARTLISVPCYVLGCRQLADRSTHHRRFGQVRACHDHDPARFGEALPLPRTDARPAPVVVQVEDDAPAGPMAPVRPFVPRPSPTPAPAFEF